MSAEATVIRAIAALVRAGADALDGDSVSAADVARSIIGLGLDLVSVEELREYLDDEARRRADLAAEVAEQLKFAGG